MNIAVIGAGAIGSVVAAYLHKAGCDYDIVRVGVVELPLVTGFCLALWLKNMDCFYWLAAVTLLGLAINFPRGGKN